MQNGWGAAHLLLLCVGGLMSCCQAHAGECQLEGDAVEMDLKRASDLLGQAVGSDELAQCLREAENAQEEGGRIDIEQWLMAWHYSRKSTWMDVRVGGDNVAFHPPHSCRANRTALTHTALRNFVQSLPIERLLGPSPKSVVVCSVLSNGAHAAVLFLSMIHHATWAPLSRTMPKDAMKWAAADLQGRVMIIERASQSGAGGLTADEEDKARQVAEELGMSVIRLEVSSDVEGLFSLVCEKEHQNTESVHRPHNEQSGADRVVMLVHTSGTTSTPKVVPVRAGALIGGAMAVVRTLLLTDQDVALNALPLHHMHGLVVNVLCTVLAGASVVCLPHFSGTSFALALQQQRPLVTWYSAVPTLHRMTVQYLEEESPTADLSHVRFVRNCSAALPVSLGERLQALFRVVLPTYAMSESVPICANPLHGGTLHGVGAPGGPAVRVKPSDRVKEDDTELKGVGEVQIKGPCVIQRYGLGEGRSLGFTSDGWLRTGDLGYWDVRGHLRLVGRCKEIVNRGGEKIAPLAVEEVAGDVLRDAVGWVEDVVAFAVPHELLGEVVAIGIVPMVPLNTDGVDEVFRPTLQQIRALLRWNGRVAEQWLPEVVVWMDSLPLTASRKKRRIGIAEELGLVEIGHGHTGYTTTVWEAQREGGPGGELGDTWTLSPANTVSAAQGRTSEGDDTVQSTDELDEQHSDLFRDEESVARFIESQVRQILPSSLLRYTSQEGALGHQPSSTGERSEESFRATPLIDLGLDSMAAITLAQSLQEATGMRVKVAALERFAAINALSNHLWKRIEAGRKRKKSSKGSKQHHGQDHSRRRRAVQDEVIAMARAGNVGFVLEKHTQFLAQGEGGVDVRTCRDRYGSNCLHWAAGGGDLAMVTVLLDSIGMKVDEGNKDGKTALMWACRNGHLEICQLLVQRGANVRARTKKGVEPIHWAVWGGSEEVTKWIVETMGVDLETLSDAGCNAAIWAAAAGKLEMCRYLHSLGANFCLLNYWGHGVVVKATWKGHAELLRWLLYEVEGVCQQVHLLNPAGEAPVDLARMACHGGAEAVLVEYMERSRRPLKPAPVQVRRIHQHKLQEIEGRVSDRLFAVVSRE